jgi:uncharacterized protein (DUF1778 family)
MTFIDKGTDMAYIYERCQHKHKKGIIMDAASQNKTERINLRVKSSAKDLIMLAAGFEGKTVSHFILTSALKCAEKTVHEHQMMTLNANDSKIFFEALSAPVRFNPKLTAAFEEYNNRVATK